jgi:hypothetical protein
MSNTPQETKDEKRMKRVLSLKYLKEVTERNLNLVRKTKRDQIVAIFSSVMIIIIGIVFIFLESVNKDSKTFKIVANSLSGVLSGSIIFSSVKGIFEINERSKIIDKITIGPSEFDIEKGDILANDKEDILEDVKRISKIVQRRNKNLNRVRIACFIFNTICSIILIALIVLNVFFSFILTNRTNRTDDYIYIISVLLIAGGMYQIFRSMILILVLIKPNILKNRSWINYFLVIPLFLTLLIRMKKEDDENNKTENESQKEDNIRRNSNNDDDIEENDKTENGSQKEDNIRRNSNNDDDIEENDKTENGSQEEDNIRKNGNNDDDIEEYDKTENGSKEKCEFEDDILLFKLFHVEFFLLCVNLVLHERKMIVRLLHGLSLRGHQQPSDKPSTFIDLVLSFFIYTTNVDENECNL